MSLKNSRANVFTRPVAALSYTLLDGTEITAANPNTVIYTGEGTITSGVATEDNEVVVKSQLDALIARVEALENA